MYVLVQGVPNQLAGKCSVKNGPTSRLVFQPLILTPKNTVNLYQLLQTHQKGVLGVGLVFWELKNEKGVRVMYHLKGLEAPITLADNFFIILVPV